MTRLASLGITAFWCVMSWLLLRSEFGDLHAVGTPVPPSLIWKRLLESSDQSLLALTHHGFTNRIGSFKWLPTTLETNLPATSNGASLPEGMTQGVLGYTIDFDGTLLLPNVALTNRARLSSQIQTDAVGNWTHLHLQISMKPMVWTIEADAVSHSIQVRTEGAGAPEESTYTLKDLTNPQGLLTRLGLFPSLPWLRPGLLSDKTSLSTLIQVDARQDHRLRFGGQRIRCFRLRFTMLGSYTADLYVNPQSGEVIRIDLPDRLTLVNESFL